jgi:hypothetical protein
MKQSPLLPHFDPTPCDWVANDNLSAPSSHGQKVTMDATALTMAALPKGLHSWAFGRIRDTLSQYNTLSAKMAVTSPVDQRCLRRPSGLL